MNRTAIPSIVFALIFANIALRAADKVSTLGELPKTDTLQIKYASTGCFHSLAYKFTFEGKATSSVSIASISEQWSEKEKKSVEAGRKHLGMVKLSGADRKGLDKLLQYYRSPLRGGCTTVDHITLSQIRDGKTIATEQFVDASCGAHRTNSITLPELAGRIGKKR